MNGKPLSSGTHQAQAHSLITGVNLYLFPSILTMLMSVCQSDLGFTSGGFKLALTAVVGLIAWSRIDEHLTSQGEVGKQEKREGQEEYKQDQGSGYLFFDPCAFFHRM